MLGIASTTVIFSVVDGVLLRPLPYPESERIVSVSQSTRSTGISQHATAPANYLDWAAQNDVFSDMATSRGGQGNLTEGDRPERLRLTAVSASFFKVFGVAPILGRALQPSDEKPGNANVVVLSQGLWQRRFGADRNVVGRNIQLNGEPHTVVGVMPASFSPDNYARALDRFALERARASAPPDAGSATLARQQLSRCLGAFETGRLTGAGADGDERDHASPREGISE